MPESEAKQALSQAHRMEIFLALVGAQDQGMTVAQSRQATAEQFGVSEHRVRKIEEEGLKEQWPPLSGTGPEVEEGGAG